MTKLVLDAEPDVQRRLARPGRRRRAARSPPACSPPRRSALVLCAVAMLAPVAVRRHPRPEPGEPLAPGVLLGAWRTCSPLPAAVAWARWPAGR